MSQVVLEISGKEANAIQALRRVIAEQEKLETGVKKTGKASKETFGQKGLAMLKGYAGGLVGAGGILAGYQLIKNEILEVMRIQEKMANKQITLSQSRKALFRNMPGSSAAEQQRAMDQVKVISNLTGVTQVALNQGLASTLSASSGDMDASVSALYTAAKYAPDDPELMQLMAGASIDIGKVTGSADPRVNMGLISAVGGMARIVNPRLQATNIPRAMIGAGKFGTSAMTGGALFAGLSTGGGDTLGAETGTAMIQLTKQLADFLPDLPNTAERIRFLQENPSKAREFLAKASFEVKSLGPIKGLLLDKSSPTAKAYASNLKKFPDEAGMGMSYDSVIAAYKQDPLNVVDETQRAMAVGEERLTTLSPGKGVRGVLRKHLKERLKESGMSSIASKIEGLNFETGDGIEKAIDIFEDRATHLSRQYDRFGRGGTGLKPHYPTQEDVAKADALFEMVRTLKDIKNNTSRTPNPNAHIEP